VGFAPEEVLVLCRVLVLLLLEPPPNLAPLATLTPLPLRLEPLFPDALDGLKGGTPIALGLVPLASLAPADPPPICPEAACDPALLLVAHLSQSGFPARTTKLSDPMAPRQLEHVKHAA
jgi:hypothetical protein